MPRLNPDDAEKRAARILKADAGDFSEALARGLRVITAFDAEHRRMTLADAARAVSLPRATVRRTLTTLVHLGYMIQDGRMYELTPRILQLSAAYLASNIGSAVLQPACERLCAQTGETCSVAVRDGEDAIMIARAAANQLINVGVGVGHRLPALHTALGRVLLAALDDEELDTFLSTAQSRPATPQTVTDKDILRAIIRKVRADGFAYVDREAMSGYQSVAVPLHRWDGRVVAALNIGAGVDRVGQATMVGPMLQAIQNAADELRDQLI